MPVFLMGTFIDLGLIDFFYTSDGFQVSAPKWREFMFTVDRMRFIAWFNGCLFERDSDAKVFVFDDDRHWEVEQRLMAWETVGLTMGGKIVSVLVNKHEGIFEEKYEKARYF